MSEADPLIDDRPDAPELLARPGARAAVHAVVTDPASRPPGAAPRRVGRGDGERLHGQHTARDGGDGHRRGGGAGRGAGVIGGVTVDPERVH